MSKMVRDAFVYPRVEKSMTGYCKACGWNDIPEGADRCPNPDCRVVLDPSGASVDTKLDSNEPSRLSAGDMIADRYVVESKLGQGGMGVVYRASDTWMDKAVALKMIHRELIENPVARDLFAQEVSICQELRHPNIIRVNDLGMWAGRHYFTMEYIAGQSLRQLLNKHLADGEFFSLESALSLISSVLAALDNAHAMVVHRDISPENIMLTENSPPVVKILDFGIAKAMSVSRLSSTAHAMGKAAYIAPEMLSPGATVDARADLYSVGVVLYEMLTGEKPMGRFPSASRVNPLLPKALDEVIDTALAMRAKDRYRDAGAFIAALNALRKVSEKTIIEATADFKIDRILRTEPVHAKKTEPSLGDKWTCPHLEAEFVFIPPGTFMMGSPKDEPERSDDETWHEVRLSKGFWLQSTAVTQGQWESVMGSNPSYFKDGGPDYPVEQVSWEDTQVFIKKLNKKTGERYRLPAESEWEYACRAGTTTPFSAGRCLGTEQANYNGNYPLPGCPKGEYRGQTTPVRQFSPNQWGLYDMHGNVWEWVQDWYGAYPTGSVTDPTGSGSGAYRVLRGGSWGSSARFCRSANRDNSDPGLRDDNIGFRLARAL